MNKNAAPQSPIGPLISLFFITFLFVFMLVCGATVFITFNLPKVYASTARIKVSHKEADSAPAGREKVVYDPVLAKTEAEVINSELIMRKVIDELNLNVTWGKKYLNNETLTSLETLDILKHRTDIHPVPETTLIQVRVFDDKPESAAEIANSIVAVYAIYAATNSNEPQVQIIDSAYANDFPVRPNVTLNIFIGIFAGIFLGSVAGAGFVLVLILKNRKSSKGSVLGLPPTNTPGPSS
jgi:capsular polysaccharide biosynthesis protein